MYSKITMFVFQIKSNLFLRVKMISKNKTKLFLFKRSIIVVLILIVISLIAFKINTEILCGLAIGYVVSLLRLKELCGFADKIICNSAGKNKMAPVKYIFVQIFTVLVLVLSAKISLNFFLSVFVGILIVPITIMLNSLSESLGLTKNNFE